MVVEHERAVPESVGPGPVTDRRAHASGPDPGGGQIQAPDAAWTPRALLALQRDAGNAAVGRMVGRASHVAVPARAAAPPPGSAARRAEPPTTVQRADAPEPAPGGSQGTAPLIAAARAGDAAAVTDLIAKGENVDAVDEFGATALIYAVDRTDRANIDLLLARGANPDIVSTEGSEDGSRGDTALKVAVLHDSPELVTLLLDHGATIGLQDLTGLDAPSWAARQGSIGCLTVFVARGRNVNLRDSYGFTLLHWAARGGRLAAVQWLLASGVDRTAIPAVLTEARRLIDAYAIEGGDLSSRAPTSSPDAAETAERDARLAELRIATEGIERVIAYLEGLPGVAPSPAPNPAP